MKIMKKHFIGPWSLFGLYGPAGSMCYVLHAQIFNHTIVCYPSWKGCNIGLKFRGISEQYICSLFYILLIPLFKKHAFKLFKILKKYFVSTTCIVMYVTCSIDKPHRLLCSTSRYILKYRKICNHIWICHLLTIEHTFLYVD